MRLQSAYRCPRAPGALPGGGGIMRAAQLSMVLACTAGREQQVP